MDLVRNPSLKKQFLVKLRERYSGVRSGIHVSDCVYCLREAYFKKVDPKPPTVKQLGFFVDGARRHKVLQGLLNVESEVEVEKYGVVGHVDMLTDGLYEKVPIEVKTTRAREAVPDHYLRQLGFYAVMLGVRRGCLVIQRLMNEEPWEFYLVEWSPSEIKFLDNELKYKANLLRSALNFRDSSMLPRVDGDMEWKCRYCLYRDLCGLDGCGSIPTRQNPTDCQKVGRRMEVDPNISFRS